MGENCAQTYSTEIYASSDLWFFSTFSTRNNSSARPRTANNMSEPNLGTKERHISGGKKIRGKPAAGREAPYKLAKSGKCLKIASFSSHDFAPLSSPDANGAAFHRLACWRPQFTDVQRLYAQIEANNLLQCMVAGMLMDHKCRAYA